MSTYLAVCLPLFLPLLSLSPSPFPLSLSFPSLSLSPSFSLSLSPPLSLSALYWCVCVLLCYILSSHAFMLWVWFINVPPLSLSLWYVMFCVCYSISLVILSKMTPSLRSSSVIILFLPFHYTFPLLPHSSTIVYYLLYDDFVYPPLPLSPLLRTIFSSLSLSFSPNSLLFSSFPLPPSPSRTQSLLLIML